MSVSKHRFSEAATPERAEDSLEWERAEDEPFVSVLLRARPGLLGFVSADAGASKRAIYNATLTREELCRLTR